MEYHLEREVRLADKSRHESLYKWSLQEYDANGDNVGEDQIPWRWDLEFSASELTHSINIEYGDSFSSSEEEGEVEVKEVIRGIIHPGFCIDGNQLEKNINYSFLGTHRKVKEFNLVIYKLKTIQNKPTDDNTEERCELWGCPSYTAEVEDFYEEEVEDCLFIYLFLSEDKFKKLLDLVKLNRVDIFRLSLAKVSGFYSGWSPSTSTNNVKILPRGFKSKVVIPKNCEVEPPELGKVGSFMISIMQRNRINLKQDLGRKDLDKIFGNEEQLPDEDEAYSHSLIFKQLNKNERILSNLKIALWVIATLLIINLFK